MRPPEALVGDNGQVEGVGRGGGAPPSLEGLLKGVSRMGQRTAPTSPCVPVPSPCWVLARGNDEPLGR